MKDCFRHMQSGHHIGKLSISFDKNETPIKPIMPPKSLTFDKDGSYLLVGGLGGLGRGLARWMAEHNARHFIFLSRSAGDSESYKTLCAELQSQGCSISIVKGSVCDISDVQKAIASKTAPLKGIFNISMVLRDDSLLRMSFEDWRAAIEPKVQGTWNLHHASLAHRLDLFVLFSSVCGVVGTPGQANYAAANAFMDAFVHYRHRSRLPASVSDLGAVEGIGHVSDNTQVLEHTKWIKHVHMSQRELFDAVTVAISNGFSFQHHADNSKTNGAQMIPSLRNINSVDAFYSNAVFFDNRFSVFASHISSGTTVEEAGTRANPLKEFVNSAATSREGLFEPKAGQFAAKEIAKWVFDLLLKPAEDESEIDTARSLHEVGLDSYAAIELRSWWRATFGLDMSVSEIMSLASFAALGEFAVDQLRRKYWPEEGNK